MEEEQFLRVEIDGFGQAPLRAVLANRGRRPFDIDYARFMYVAFICPLEFKSIVRLPRMFIR